MSVSKIYHELVNTFTWHFQKVISKSIWLIKFWCQSNSIIVSFNWVHTTQKWVQFSHFYKYWVNFILMHLKFCCRSVVIHNTCFECYIYQFAWDCIQIYLKDLTKITKIQSFSTYVDLSLKLWHKSWRVISTPSRNTNVHAQIHPCVWADLWFSFWGLAFV